MRGLTLHLNIRRKKFVTTELRITKITKILYYENLALYSISLVIPWYTVIIMERKISKLIHYNNVPSIERH